MARANSIISRAIELGRKGRLRIAPERISISATEACNLECIMCPGHAGKSGPTLSIEQAEALFLGLTNDNVHMGQPKLLDMTAGEPTLNRDLGPIYRKFKELYPNAKISMISNATVPVRGRIREAFELTDYVGMSMDGATPATYERIRKGSVYKNVVRNVRDVATIKKEGVNCDSVQLLFVAMDQNIHELAEMVRLAHSLGVPRVFMQESEVRTTPFNTEGQNIALNLSNAELSPFVAEAVAEAKRLGVELTLTSRLQDALKSDSPSGSEYAQSTSTAENITQPRLTLKEGIKSCHYPWFYAPRVVQNRSGEVHPTLVCCHMPHADEGGNLRRHPELKQKSIVEIFNSEVYWNFRARLLDGTLATTACRDCQYFRMTQWTPKQLRDLETVVNEELDRGQI